MPQEIEELGGAVAFQKIEGMLALERRKVLLESNLSSGDLVEIFYTPNGDFIISKSDEGEFQINKITSAYISFEKELL